MKVLVNITSTDSSYASAPSNFIELEAGDYFIFTEGDANVADGQAIPTSQQLSEASSIIPGAGEEAVNKVFLADISAGILREIPLIGLNKRYVFCVSFDGATSSEPILELWDDTDYDSYVLQILGSGTPNDSLIDGVVTTSGLPGEDWIGKPLAGSLDANRLLLNDGSGALSVATDLYFNIRVKIKSTFDPAVENPVFLVKYYYNM